MRRERGSNNARDLDLIVISNSSVITALARIRRLDLLEKLFGEVVVPEAVWREITIEGKPDSEKILEACFIYVEKARDEMLASLPEELYR